MRLVPTCRHMGCLWSTRARDGWIPAGFAVGKTSCTTPHASIYLLFVYRSVLARPCARLATTQGRQRIKDHAQLPSLVHHRRGSPAVCSWRLSPIQRYVGIALPWEICHYLQIIVGDPTFFSSVSFNPTYRSVVTYLIAGLLWG